MFNKVISNSFLIFFFLFLQVNKAQGDKLVWCEVLQTSFFGSAPVQVQCGEDPEAVGWISNNAKIHKIILKLRDRDTGQERMLSRKTQMGPDGGTIEVFGVNIWEPLWKFEKDSYRGRPLPIGLFIPGGCGSNKIFNALTFDLFKNNKRFLTADEECSWLNENNTNWRSVVTGIGRNEDVLYIRYALKPGTRVYYDKAGKERKGTLSTFYVQSSRSDFYCESFEGSPLLLFSNNTKCDSNKTVPICIGRSAWCSSPSREFFEFLKYGCKALEDGSCPSIVDCIFGRDSFYSSHRYIEVTRTSFETTRQLYYFKNKSSQSGSGDR